MSELEDAFMRVRTGFSPDRVVADPVLNKAFLLECRHEGLEGSDADVNQRLLNMRKSGRLRKLKSRRTSFPDQDDYIFASEIAVRHIERKDGLSLDRIICDPKVAAEFDAIASRIAPGYSPLQYRWAALSLRKTRRLRPETLSHVVKAVETRLLRVADVELAELPPEQGLYVFYERKNTLYVGETRSLRNRIAKHLDHSDNKGLARWLWQASTEGVSVEYHVLPRGTSTRVRRAMEAELIQSRKPIFNVAMVRVLSGRGRG